MFGINTYSRLRTCILRQHYVTSGKAMKILSVAEEVDGGYNVKPYPGQQCAAGVHTSTVRAKNLMKKFLNKSKKKLWYETPPQSSSSQPDFMRPPKKRGQEDNNRCRILNSVLFKAITDLLTSLELKSEVIDYNVEISRVSISPDFSSCGVYWKTSGMSELDGVIQSALERISPRIRYLIMSHQIMGGVPPLVFIKDKQYAALVEVEKLLQTADFGPEDLNRHQDGGEQLQRTDSSHPAPSAKPVLFGVDHEALGRQIQDYKQRAKEAGSGSEAESFPALTQAQLTALEEYRKQKIVEKRKKKSKRPVDDDITPKEFLEAQHRWDQEVEPDEGGAFRQENTQLVELMAEENRKS